MKTLFAFAALSLAGLALAGSGVAWAQSAAPASGAAEPAPGVATAGSTAATAPATPDPSLRPNSGPLGAPQRGGAPIPPPPVGALVARPGDATSAPAPARQPRPPRPPVARPTQAALMLQLETSVETPSISVAIYSSAEAMRAGTDPVRTLQVQRTGAVSRAWVVGMAPGRYAVVAFQDVDGDGKISRSLLGPKEPIGYSTNPRVGRTAPTFDAIAFDLPAGAGGAQTITIRPVGGLFR